MEDQPNTNSHRLAEPPEPAADRTSSPGRRTLGAWLRTQREARGVSLDEIADASKISRRYLEALENDRFDVLPAPVFVRGFLREYARVAGLDADEVVNLYLLAKPATRERPGAAPAGKKSAAARRRGGSLWVYVVLLVALLAIFLGVAAGISWWAGRNAAPRSSAPRSAVDAQRPEPEARPADAVPESPAATSPGVESTVVASADAEPAVAVDEAQPQTPLLAVPDPTPIDSLRVVLEFQQDCWVEVVVDGHRRESELKAGGETLALDAKDYVELTLGNAPAVRLEVNGRQMALGASGTRVVRSMRIDRQSLAASAENAAARPQ